MENKWEDVFYISNLAITFPMYGFILYGFQSIKIEQYLPLQPPQCTKQNFAKCLLNSKMCREMLNVSSSSLNVIFWCFFVLNSFFFCMDILLSVSGLFVLHLKKDQQTISIINSISTVIQPSIGILMASEGVIFYMNDAFVDSYWTCITCHVLSLWKATTTVLFVCEMIGISTNHLVKPKTDATTMNSEQLEKMDKINAAKRKLRRNNNQKEESGGIRLDEKKRAVENVTKLETGISDSEKLEKLKDARRKLNQMSNTV